MKPRLFQTGASAHTPRKVSWRPSANFVASSRPRDVRSIGEGLDGVRRSLAMGALGYVQTAERSSEECSENRSRPWRSTERANGGSPITARCRHSTTGRQVPLRKGGQMIFQRIGGVERAEPSGCDVGDAGIGCLAGTPRSIGCSSYSPGPARAPSGKPPLASTPSRRPANCGPANRAWKGLTPEAEARRPPGLVRRRRRQGPALLPGQRRQRRHRGDRQGADRILLGHGDRHRQDLHRVPDHLAALEGRAQEAHPVPGRSQRAGQTRPWSTTSGPSARRWPSCQGHRVPEGDRPSASTRSTPAACARPSSTRTRTWWTGATATSCASPATTRRDRRSSTTSSTRSRTTPCWSPRRGCCRPGSTCRPAGSSCWTARSAP